MNKPRFLRMTWLSVIALTLVSGPIASPTSAVIAGAEAVFHPETFFLGQTEGTGRLKIIFRPAQSVQVRGFGWIAPSGALILDQDVVQGLKPLKKRRWEMRPLGGGAYAATLSDATGPVVGIVQGNTLRLAFPAKGGLRIKQVLIVAPDGRRASNRLTIRKFGIVVAVLNETITRVDPSQAGPEGASNGMPKHNRMR